MTTDTLIEARRLSRMYGNNVAVSELNLTLGKGEILGLLGPNGAGKTTTMRMLTGCLAPSGGEVRINGISLADDPAGAKRSLGYLPEKPPVYPELTVNEYLGYCAGLHGIPGHAREAAVAKAAEACGLTQVAHRLIGNLSKGYQQRVGLAQAIIHRPPVIILDEPTVGLDPIQIREIRSLIAELGREHSVILSSHILPEIQAVCSRVMIINQGRVVYADTMENAQDGQFDSFRIALSQSADTAALAAITAVSSVDELGDNEYRLHHDKDADPRAELVKLVADRGWGLLELVPERTTLEEIFVNLTSGEARPAEAA